MKHLLNICNINGAEVEPVPDSSDKEQYKDPHHLFAMWWNRQVQTQITDKTSIKTYCRNCTGDYVEVK